MLELLASSVRLGTTSAFAALGESVAERAGVLNIGLEGMLLATAFGAAAGGAASGSALVAVLSAVVAGMLCAGVIAVLVVYMRADQIVVGLAFNLFALGLTSFLYRTLYADSSPSIPTLSAVRVPVLVDLPWIGPIFFAQPGMVYLLVVIAPLTWLLMQKSGWGLRVRTAGNSPETLHSVGGHVQRTRFFALLWTGALAGLAGAYLLLVQAGQFTEGMSGGRGFVAIAAVVFGGWRVAGVVAASFLFGLAEALQFQLPAMGVSVPTPVLLALPYLIALVAVSILPQRDAAPAKLMVPFHPNAS